MPSGHLQQLNTSLAIGVHVVPVLPPHCMAVVQHYSTEIPGMHTYYYVTSKIHFLEFCDTYYAQVRFWLPFHWHKDGMHFVLMHATLLHFDNAIILQLCT